MQHDETYGIASGTAAKAFEDLFFAAHGKRRCLFSVNGTAGFIVAVQFHEGSDHLGNVCGAYGVYGRRCEHERFGVWGLKFLVQ